MEKELSKAAEAQLEAAETLDEVVRILAEEGTEITKEELITALDAADGELNEDALERVAGGGVSLRLMLWLIRKFPKAYKNACAEKPKVSRWEP